MTRTARVVRCAEVARYGAMAASTDCGFLTAEAEPLRSVLTERSPRGCESPRVDCSRRSRIWWPRHAERFHLFPQLFPRQETKKIAAIVLQPFDLIGGVDGARTRDPSVTD